MRHTCSDCADPRCTDHDHENFVVDAIDQTWGVICCSCDTVLAADWMDETVPPELEARANANLVGHLCNREDCRSKRREDDS